MVEVKRRRGIPCAVLLALATAAGAIGDEGALALPAGEDFGAGITLTEISDLGAVVSDPERYADTPVLVRGRISDVCQMRGCWLMLADGPYQVRIRFAEYAFFVPEDCRGKWAYVEGRVGTETLSEREALHFAAESIGGDPAAIHGPQEVVSFIATGVRIVRER